MRVRFALAGCLLSWLTVQAALADDIRPEIAVDVGTGLILSEKHADVSWAPASLTKLMTLYVALEAVAAGEVSFETPVVVSAGAAAAPPSKIGVAAGTAFRLDDALKLMILRSANDLAAAVAEAIAGSVPDFADRMNATAGRLGMGNTHFTNASGLFEPGQRTTARDMAVLARTLSGVPAAKSILAIERISFSGRVIASHNGAVGRSRSVDGMKTGYVCASGFNVVTSASEGGRQTVAVVMGYPSGKSRDARALALIEDAARITQATDPLTGSPPSSETEPDRSEEFCSGSRLRPGLVAPNPEEVASYLRRNRVLSDPVEVMTIPAPVVVDAVPLPAAADMQVEETTRRF